MKNIVKEFKLGELFCGPGGLALGATTAKIEDSDYKIIHKWANDYDKDTCNTYTRNICPDDGDSVICGDVRKLDIDSLGDIDALAFGFPCNDFSVVGEQKGFDGVYGPLYTYGVKVLKKYKPLWFLAENVGGLKSANDGKAFQKIQEEAQQIAKFPIYYVDSAATVDQIKDTIQYFQDTLAKDKWLVVMLDHTLLVRGRSDESALNIN